MQPTAREIMQVTQPAMQPTTHECDARPPAVQPAAREAKIISLEDAAASSAASCASKITELPAGQPAAREILQKTQPTERKMQPAFSSPEVLHRNAHENIRLEA